MPVYSNNCGGHWENGGPEPPRLWNRSQGDMCNENTSKMELDMRRKAEVLKYTNNTSKLTKKQQFSNVVNKTSTSNKKYYGNCKKRDLQKYTSSSSNVPGQQELYYNKNVPLTRWIIQKQYNSGSEKWPQYSSK
jgi:hypothetical protein